MLVVRAFGISSLLAIHHCFLRFWQNLKKKLEISKTQRPQKKLKNSNNLAKNVRKPKKNLNHKSLRKKVYYLSQKSLIVENSIMKNITLENTTTDLEHYNKVINDLSLEDLKDNLLLKENAKNISGGQLQKILLARCFYHKKNIIILDESTSSIDTQNELKIAKLIKLYSKKGLTFIIIGHRSTLFDLCDNVLAM